MSHALSARGPQLSLGLILSLCLAGCTAAAPEKGEGTQVVWTDQGFTISGQPDLDIAGKRDGQEIFLGVTDAVSLSNGSLAVIDGFGQHALILNPAGEVTQTIGTPGSGPGEFQMPRWGGECAPDSLFIWDAMTSRISVVDSLGSFGPQASVPALPDILACNAHRVFLIVTAAAPGSQSAASGASLITSLRGDTLGTLGMVPTSSSTLLGAVPTAGVGSDWIAFGGAESDRVTIYSLSGKKLRDFSTNTEARPVTEQHIEKALDARMELIERSDKDSLIRVMLRKGPVAKKLPHYSDIFVDENDLIWVVSSFPGDGFTELRIFGGEDAAPALLRIGYDLTVLDIHYGRVVARMTDADGIQHLLVFKVARDSTAAAGAVPE